MGRYLLNNVPTELVMLPVEVLALAQAMYRHGYSMKEITNRTDLTMEQIEELSIQLSWGGLDPPYEKADINLGLSPAETRNTRVSSASELTPFPKHIRQRDLVTQFYILRLIEKGVPVIQAFSSVGFSQAGMDKWLIEDGFFAAAVSRVTAAYGAEYLRKIESSTDKDWKAAGWILERHPHTKDHFATKTVTPVQTAIQVNVGFKRGEDGK